MREPGKGALTDDDLAPLRGYDTPTVCNAIEIVYPDRRAHGFTTRSLHCVRPELPPMVGFARTVTVRAYRPAAMSADAQAALRFGYLDYLSEGPGPTVSVVQDLDDAQAGFGAFWGEVNSTVHRALGCLGTVTNGSVRDLNDLAEGFQALAGVLAPSHGHVHVTGFGEAVNIAGMVVQSGDVIHADRHGAVVVPADAVTKIPEAVALVARREKVILDAARAPDASAETIKAAWRAAAKVR